MAGLDLSALQGVFTPWLVDELELLRDNQYVGDDDIDIETGDLTVPAPILIYDGLGMVQPLTHGTLSMEAMAAATAAGANYRALFPADAVFVTQPRPGDILRVKVVNGATLDEHQKTQQFRLVDFEQVSGWNVIRFLYMKRINAAASDEPQVP